MSEEFGRLAGALQYQIVHGMGFRSLRDVQRLSIDPLLDGHNAVILAPTAGGKTEAAFFPLLSRMVDEHWPPVSVLYISPIRALINNQETRLARLADLLGRRAAVWHGDVTASRRKAILREPPDILLTTPESLEVMLMSANVPARTLFAGLQAVVIDEVHAFVSDDRGGHLGAVLERLSRFCRRDVQRIGLSATVGNPEVIVEWLAGSSRRKGVLVDPPRPAVQPQVTIDYVGTLENTAAVIGRLHRGRKRLVFADSRAKVERIGELLHQADVRAFVLHSALSRQARQDAERAFEAEKDCVIVATSTLELGIDIGDLDHVLQIDAPATVASFVQRMGRTGRRPGTVPNCTFLCTSDDALTQATAMVRLHDRGWIEPVEPVRHAAHLAAHQLMALAVQEGGIPRSDWWGWISETVALRDLSDQDREELVEHMLAEDILADTDGRLWLGGVGEARYGARHFLSLYAVFDAPPSLTVFAGRRTIGSVEATFVAQLGGAGGSFTLGARAWRITSIDWERGWLHVVPAPKGKTPRWQGTPRFLSPTLCGEMRAVLVEEQDDPRWSKRARLQLAAVRELRAEEAGAGDALLQVRDGYQLFTFAGGRANLLLAGVLEGILGARVAANNERLWFREAAGRSVAAIGAALVELAAAGRPDERDALVVAARMDGARLSKFQGCLPGRLLVGYLTGKLNDISS